MAVTKLLFENLGPTKQTHTGSANGVNFGRGYLFFRPMADGKSVWGKPGVLNAAVNDLCAG